MKKIKFLFLVLILLVPVLIFMFLKFAGSNTFSIPVYYTDGVPAAQRFDCDFASGPFTVPWPDSLEATAEILVIFSDSENEGQAKNNILQRITGNTTQSTGIFLFTENNDLSPHPGITTVKIQPETMKQRMHCLIASDTLDQFALIDKKGRIRGYYDLTLEEQDRLLVELAILSEEND